MNAAVRRSAVAKCGAAGVAVQNRGATELLAPPHAARSTTTNQQSTTVRVCIDAESRLLREALVRMLSQRSEFKVLRLNLPEAALFTGPDEAGALVLLLASSGRVEEDLRRIREARGAAPAAHVLFLGMMEEEEDFLQFVRAGISGYLRLDVSVEELAHGIVAVSAGEAVCPGALCAGLFRFHEREARRFPSALLHRALGLTRREQQIVPLLAQGLTNKEIARRFNLSEQTVKNHLYRMKHKTGAENRFGIVDLCRRQGLPV